MNLIKYKPEKMSWADVGNILNINRSYAYNIAKFPHKHNISKVLRIGKLFNLPIDRIKTIWSESKIEAQTMKIKESLK